MGKEEGYWEDYNEDGSFFLKEIISTESHMAILNFIMKMEF